MMFITQIKRFILHIPILKLIVVRTFFYLVAVQHGVQISFQKNNTIHFKKKNQILISSFENYIYSYDLIAKFDYYFNTVKPKKLKNILAVDFSKPALHILKKSNIPFYFTSLVEDELPLEGYIKQYMPKKGDIIFDCGAYCGVISYYFSKYVGNKGKVFAFEPDEKNFTILKKNIALHHLKNVIPIQAGVYGKNGEFVFNTEGGPGSAPQEVLERNEKSQQKTTTMMTIKRAYERYKLKKVHLIKLDIEGAEIETIEGSLQFIKTHPTHFAIASYHMRDGQKTYKKLELLFKKMHYAYKTGNQEHLTTWAWK